MNLKIAENIENINTRYYADAKKLDYNIIIDCSDGENPYGCSKKVMKVLEKIKCSDITNYSYDDTLKKEIANYWNINTSNIVLSAGSVEGLYYVNQIFNTKDATLLTFVPHFPNYSNHARMLGYKHRQVFLDKNSNYKYDVSSIRSRGNNYN